MKVEKKLLTDENMNPVAVVIEYAQWKQIERVLEGLSPNEPTADLAPYVGSLKDWPEDPVEYQRGLRDEWS